MEDLRRALNDCLHPVLKIGIVSAGLVRSASLIEDTEAPGAGIPSNPVRYVAEISLSAPNNDYEMAEQLVAVIENRLLGEPSISRVHVQLESPLFPML